MILIDVRRVAVRGAVVLAGLLCVSAAAAEWTLESSIARALAVAPEVAAAAAGREAQQGALRQAGAWPNPSVELRADDRLARELGGGGRDLTQIAITQPLPLGRIKPRQAVAAAGVRVAEAAEQAERLGLERRVAEAFHRLQRDQALLALARGNAEDAAAFAHAGARRAAAGDVSRREALRLEVMAAQAAQAVEQAEGEWAESAYALAALLALAPDELGALAPLTVPPPPAALEHFAQGAADHPSLHHEQGRQAVLTAERAVARAEALPGVSLTLYRERDVFAGSREPVTGAGLTVELPLWDRRGGRRDELAALGRAQRERVRTLERDLQAELRVSHLHLTHLVDQARHHRGAVLEPAREVRALTERGYQRGEVDLPALIDAVETARAAEGRQQQLLADAWLELAALRHAAGEALHAVTTTDFEEAGR
ncbi:TolC family protein [Ectothiorhodospiraceae bacterium 2226]|nr:TolC family protein [Ectothiorhodospiraceae bacterium 2226]